MSDQLREASGGGEVIVGTIPNKRSLVILVVTAALIVTLVAVAGCGSTTTTAATTASTTATSEESTGTTAPATGTPIKIGLLCEKTGALAAYGYAHELVAEGVVAKINAEGGIGGRPIELIVEDTASDSSTGANKMRKLIENDGVDFVVGSNTSAVVLAVAPIAKELKTVYLSTAGGAGLTEPGKGNRYVFELNTDTKQEANAATKFAVDNVGKKWATAVVDYSWGWDAEQFFIKAMTEVSGSVSSSVRVPVGTSDWLKYLTGKVPDDTEGVFFANFGTDFLSFIRDLAVINPNVAKIGANYVLSGQDISTLGAVAEGLYVLSGYPQYASAKNTQFDLDYRAAIGMDEFGREVGTGTFLVPSYQWSTWESIYAIKEVVEDSGWATKADTPKFIEALEGRTFEEGIAHPEGTKTIRAEDHLCLKGLYIEQVKDGELIVAEKLAAEDISYPASVNYQESEPF